MTISIDALISLDSSIFTHNKNSQYTQNKFLQSDNSCQKYATNMQKIINSRLNY